MKHRCTRAAAALAAALLAGAVLLSGCGTSSAAQGTPQGASQPAADYGPWVQADAAYEASGAWAVPKGGSAGVEIDVPQSGTYWMLLTYKTQEDVMLRSVMDVSVDGQSCITQLFSLWRDESKDYGEDRYGNQLLPTQVTQDDFVSDWVADQALVARQPFAFTLSAGAHTVTFASEDVGVEIRSVQLVKAEQPQSYAQYAESVADRPQGGDVIVIEGEDYAVKSDSSIRAGAQRKAQLSPYDYTRRLLNVLDGASYADAGQKVQYVFEVESAGLYRIAFHYNQDGKEDIPVYQNIRIDGRALFGEMLSVAFPYTGVDYETLVLRADGQDAWVYLPQGSHTLTLEADGTPVQDAVTRLQTVMDKLSSIGLDIKKLSGTQADENRTWDVESYLPGVLEELEACQSELWSVYDALGALQAQEPAAALGIRQAANNLGKVLEDPDRIPGKLSLLSEGSGSAAQLLADQIDKLKGQGLTIDAIYVQSGEFAQEERAGVWSELWDGVKRFFYSLTLNEADTDGDDVLTVWINRPLQYVEVLQTMADTQFTPQTGIRVQFSVMSSEQRIILSNATDMAPDVVMGLATNTPFDLGLRGAVADLTQFEGFADVVSEYNPESLTPYTLGEKVFGLTETQDFYILFYRTDILEQLGLSVPRTWQDVVDLMPVLQRNSMNFYLQLSAYSGTKPLYTTAPFLMQAGGGIYTQGDAATTAVNSAQSLQGFEMLTDLYRLYSVQPTVSSFYNSFRYGQIPMGIGSFSDYVTIKNAAPEIADKWAVALAPGFEDENGEIHNGTTGASSACAILSGSDKQQQAWEFLRWWLSSETQITFGNTLQTTYGPEYLWNSANIEAFQQLNFPEDDREVILQQWSSMQEINRHPAMYVVERELSNAWQDVVENNVPVRIALDDAAMTINREFRRKLTEFGYFDEDGNELEPFVYVPVEEILEGLS